MSVPIQPEPPESPLAPHPPQTPLVPPDHPQAPDVHRPPPIDPLPGGAPVEDPPASSGPDAPVRTH